MPEFEFLNSIKQLAAFLPGIWAYASAIVVFLWPFIAFVVLIAILRSTWFFWRQTLFEHSTKFILLELRIPREVRKSPRAMEQVLMAIHALRNTANDLQEKYWDGEVTRWYSLEIVSFSGETHFYIRTYYKQKRLVEAAFFSYYPDVEVVEVPDYIDRMPANVVEMEEQGYEVWGSEMVLAKEDAYPIRTYADFEAPDEERQFDPISVFLEVLGKLKQGEIVGIQIILAPEGPEWAEHWEHLVETLQESKKKEKRMTIGEGAVESFSSFTVRTPGQTDILKAVEKNLSKPAFETILRFVYFSPKSIFYDSFARRGLVGSFNQYASLDLNRFVQNYSVSTRTKIWNFPFVFPNLRNEYRKRRLIFNYRHRQPPPETFMGRVLTSTFFNWNSHTHWFSLNTECIATLFHPPTFLVLTAPHIQRMESRKVGPPAGLAIYGDESDLADFQ